MLTLFAQTVEIVKSQPPSSLPPSSDPLAFWTAVLLQTGGYGIAVFLVYVGFKIAPLIISAWEKARREHDEMTREERRLDRESRHGQAQEFTKAILQNSQMYLESLNSQRTHFREDLKDFRIEMKEINEKLMEVKEEASCRYPGKQP